LKFWLNAQEAGLFYYELNLSLFEKRANATVFIEFIVVSQTFLAFTGVRAITYTPGTRD